MAKNRPSEVLIEKFDILATYTYAKGVLQGLTDDEAKQRAMVAAITGAHARIGMHTARSPEFQDLKAAAEKKKKTTITAESFNKQVAQKIGGFFDTFLLPTITKLIEAHVSYEDVKRILKISPTWGDKITAEQFRERSDAFLNQSRAR